MPATLAHGTAARTAVLDMTGRCTSALDTAGPSIKCHRWGLRSLGGTWAREDTRLSDGEVLLAILVL
jgi:hypothetical protein